MIWRWSYISRGHDLRQLPRPTRSEPSMRDLILVWRETVWKELAASDPWGWTVRTKQWKLQWQHLPRKGSFLSAAGQKGKCRRTGGGRRSKLAEIFIKMHQIGISQTRTARYIKMCLKLSKTANRIPLANLLPWYLPFNSNIDEKTRNDIELTLRAIRIDHSNMPNMNPLYWKCMWSTIISPGWRNKDADIILCVEGSTAPRTNLGNWY